MTAKKMDKEIKHIDPKIEKDSEDHWGYRVLLTAATHGPYSSTRQIVKAVEKNWPEYPKSVIEEMCRRAVRNRIVFVGHKYQKAFLNAEIFQDSLGLALGVNVLRGYITMDKAKPAQEPAED